VKKVKKNENSEKSGGKKNNKYLSGGVYNFN